MTHLFSKTFLAAPAGQTDSVRLRKRLGTFAFECLFYRMPRGGDLTDRFARAVKTECGCEFPSGGPGFGVDSFYGRAELVDVLDSITILGRVLVGAGRLNVQQEWVAFSARAMREESMAYEVLADGAVRYLVDTAFQETRDAVIAALGADRFKASRICIEEGVSALTSIHPNGKTAIRATFEGLETLFKVVTNDNKNLTSSSVAQLLQPIVSRAYAGTDAIAQGAADQVVQSFRDWINACHKYRHGHDQPEPVEPPLDLSVVLVGSGLNYARWLAAFAP